MRHPVQPPAHRVNVQLNTHISTDNAEAWRHVVESFGGSVELAFDALLVNSTPGLKLGRPKGFYDKLMRVRYKAEVVESTHEEACSLVDQDLEKIQVQLEVALVQLGDATTQLNSLKMSLIYARKRLTSQSVTKATDDLILTMDKAEKMLDDFSTIITPSS